MLYSTLTGTTVTQKMFIVACWELYTILEPRMHCDMKPLIVTIVEIHMQIIDVCLCLSQAVQNVLMHHMITIFFRSPDYRIIAEYHFKE